MYVDDAFRSITYSNMEFLVFLTENKIGKYGLWN